MSGRKLRLNKTFGVDTPFLGPSYP